TDGANECSNFLEKSEALDPAQQRWTDQKIHTSELTLGHLAPDPMHEALSNNASMDSAPSPSFYVSFGKHAIDVVLAVLMVPIVLLVLLMVAPLMIRDTGPFFYKHPRVGRKMQMFDCHKIRTMRMDSQEQLANLLRSDPVALKEWTETQKLQNDPRITRFGHFFRKTSIDELPQLWNVLKGEMSLIGPRPVTLEEIGRYGLAAQDYSACRPGITGLWQISPARYDLTYADRVELDVSYTRSITFKGDAKILWGTLRWALKPNGV
ncbi:MAG: sugar transferase, partial [Paracoccaceae bacterium]